MKLLIFLLCFVTLQGEILWELQEGPFHISLEASSKSIKPSETLNLTLVIRYPTHYQVRISEDWPSSPMSAFSLFSMSKDEIEEQDGKQLSIHYQLLPLLTGRAKIQLTKIDFLDHLQAIETIVPPLLSIDVDSIPQASYLIAEPLLPLDILHPIEMNRQNRLTFEKTTLPSNFLTLLQTHSFPIKNLIIALLLISTLPLIIVLLKNRKIQDQETSRVKLLNYLKTIRPISSQNISSDVYQNINTLFRSYIQETFNVKAPHLTTEEFLIEASQKKEISENKQELLKTFLKESDRIKFKGKSPTYKDLELSLKLIKEIIC